jgi:Cof subfamily protein (haloacid dehalogenase superfamily)
MRDSTKYRLVALDLDGTLLDSTLRIRRGTIHALRQVRDEGARVMIVTGRHHTATHAYWWELDLELPAICCNGGYVYDFRAGRAIAGDPFTRAEARELLGIVRRHPLDTMIYTDEAMTFENDAPHLAAMRQWSATLPEPLRPRLDRVDTLERVIDEAGTLWKFLIVSEDHTCLETFVQAIRARGFACVRSSRNCVDVARAGNSKGRRLAEFAARWNVAARETIAFGDQENDMEMLAFAGLGVAMGNGHPKVRACADWVTGSNDGDGIADALRRFVLARQS